MVSCRLSERETDNIVAFCRAHRLGLNSVFSAVVLLAEWQLRGTPNIPVPFIYTVDLRYFLSPPVSATGCTNPVGLATYLAEIDRKTRVVDLARDIAETFRADLSDGVIQQSRLHFSPQYVGNPPGLPDVVMHSDNGLVPPVRTPPDLEVTGTHGELYFAVSAGIEIYFTQIFAGQLNVEYHSHGPAPEKVDRGDTFAALRHRRAAGRNRCQLNGPERVAVVLQRSAQRRDRANQAPRQPEGRRRPAERARIEERHRGQQSESRKLAPGCPAGSLTAQYSVEPDAASMSASSAILIASQL